MMNDHELYQASMDILGNIDRYVNLVAQLDKQQRLAYCLEIKERLADLVEEPTHLPYALDSLEMDLVNPKLRLFGYALLSDEDTLYLYRVNHLQVCNQVADLPPIFVEPFTI